MQIFNIRYHLHLLRRQALTLGFTLFALVSVLTPLRGQSARGNYNFMDFQRRNYYFGITLGYNQSTYRVYRSERFVLNDSVSGVENVFGKGFNVNIVSNLRLGDYFDIRFMPGFSFASRSLMYDAARKGRPDYPNKIESVFVELPFQVRYTSAPYRDKRLFLISGLKYAYDIQAKSRVRTLGNLVKISPTDFSFEYGVGLQMFFPYFIFSPEFKVSQGLGNMLIYNGTLRESNVLEKLLSRTFSISLHFEG